jgi:hypothetical protein
MVKEGKLKGNPLLSDVEKRYKKDKNAMNNQ